MTCIIGLKIDGKIYMAADGQATKCTQNMKLSDPKIYRKKPDINENMLIGISGTIRLANLVDSFELPLRNSIPPKEYMIKNVVPAFRKHIEEAKYIDEIETRWADGGELLIAYENDLWVLEPHFAICQLAENCWSVGDAEDAAISMCESYLENPDKGDPQLMLLSILEIIAKHNITVGPPFVVEKL